MDPNPNNANRRSQHDHGSPMGSPIAEAFRIRAWGRGDHDRSPGGAVVVHEMIIAVHASTQISVGGVMHYETAAMLLDRARDAIKGYRIQPGKMLEIPGKDLGMPGISKITVEGPVDRTDYSITIIDRVHADLDAQHPIEAEHARAAASRIQI